MGFALVEDLPAVTGNGSSATITPSAVPAAGDLVVLYVNRNGTGTISADSGGAAFIERVNEIPSGETSRHALYTKVANGSEPSSYGLTFGSSDHYQVLMKVFSSSTPAVVDSAANTDITSANSTNIVINAINGAVISDNALSLVFGGKDNRFTGNSYSPADNSYLGALGKTDNEAAAGAYRIYTTGETFSGSVAITNSGSAPSDKTYSVHISFVESAGGTDVSVDLSGIEAQASQGGVSATSGALTPLTGQDLTSDQGTLNITSGALTPLTGQSLTLSQGSLTVSVLGGVSVGLAGQSLSIDQGALTISGGATTTISGQESTANLGVLGVSQSQNILLSSQSSAVSQGLLSPSGGSDVTLLGQQADASQGDLITNGGIQVTIDGQSIGVSQGVVLSTGSASIPLTGQQIDALQGALGVSLDQGVVVSLQGQQIVVGQGFLTVDTPGELIQGFHTVAINYVDRTTHLKYV